MKLLYRKSARSEKIVHKIPTNVEKRKCLTASNRGEALFVKRLQCDLFKCRKVPIALLPVRDEATDQVGVQVLLRTFSKPVLGALHG